MNEYNNKRKGESAKADDAIILLLGPPKKNDGHLSFKGGYIRRYPIP